MGKGPLIKNQAKKMKTDILIEADGGINLDTIKIASKSGVDICVAGTSVFKSTDTGKTIDNLKRAAITD